MTLSTQGAMANRNMKTTTTSFHLPSRGSSESMSREGVTMTQWGVIVTYCKGYVVKVTVTDPVQLVG